MAASIEVGISIQQEIHLIGIAILFDIAIIWILSWSIVSVITPVIKIPSSLDGGDGSVIIQVKVPMALACIAQ